uniref:Transposase n=1 Tax=Magnetococcus massalia (strain MO-1) TaxID=451514 RepID=A0A1S7LK55_MAGMO|nr:Conserved protein of unknown function [Candidatus Magnetococcus massalia]
MVTGMTDKQRYWLGHIHASEQFDGSVKAYADAHGLEVNALYDWKNRLGRKGLLDLQAEEPPRFEKLIVEESQEQGGGASHVSQRGNCRGATARDKPVMEATTASGLGTIMMRPDNDLPEVFVCRDPVDFRKGNVGLAALVESELELDPLSSQLFVFTNRRRNGVKVLYWERNGFCLWQKRLEQERFHWLHRSAGSVGHITGQQLNWLLDGYDITRMKPHKTLEYSCIS